MNVRLNQKISNLKRGVDRLQEALSVSIKLNELAIDATIQRFEFCYELLWKTLKVALEIEGVSSNTPREVFQEAYRAKLIENEVVWLNMIKDRNTTAHVYDEVIALQIYEHIKLYASEMNKVLSRLVQLKS